MSNYDLVRAPERNGPYWLRSQAPARSSWEDETWDALGYFTVGGDWAKELLVVIALTARCGQLLIYPHGRRGGDRPQRWRELNEVEGSTGGRPDGGVEAGVVDEAVERGLGGG